MSVICCQNLAENVNGIKMEGQMCPGGIVPLDVPEAVSDVKQINILKTQKQTL